MSNSDVDYEELMRSTRAEFGRRLAEKDAEIERLKREVEALKRDVDLYHERWFTTSLRAGREATRSP